MTDIVLSLGIDAGASASGADDFIAQYSRLKAAISDATTARASSRAAIASEAAASATAAGVFEQEAQKRIRVNEAVKDLVIARGQEQAALEAALARTGSLNQVGEAAVGINKRFAASVAQLNAELSGGAQSASAHADATGKMGAASNAAAASQQTLSMGTAGVTREIIVLGREIATGNFSRIPGSLLVLTNRMGVLSLGTLGTVAAFGALAAALAYPIVHAANLDQEMRSLNAQLAATGNTAMVTAQQIKAMADSISPSTSASRSDIMGASRQIASDNTIAPNIAVAQLEKLTDAAISFAQVTGQQVAPATKQLTEALDGGVTSLAKLNEQYPIFTAAELENLKAMGEHGQTAEALAIEIKKIDDYFHSAAQGGMSDFTKSMNEAGAAWTRMMDRLGESGPVQAALTALAGLANAAAGTDAGQIANGKIAIKRTQAQIDDALRSGDQDRLGNLVQHQIVNQTNQSGWDTAPTPSAVDLLGSVPSFSFGGTTVSGAGGDPRAAEHLANQQAADDAAILAQAYEKTGVAQQLAIAHARDFAGAQDTVNKQDQSQAKFLADSIVIMAQHNAAVAASNLAVQQQIGDTDALQEAWNASTGAGIVAEATQKALTAARANDSSATATAKQINDQLTISYNQASQAAGQFIQTLKLRDKASADIVSAGGDKEAEAQIKITEQVNQQFATELALAQAIKDRTGDADALLQVQQQMGDAAALLRDIHKNDLTGALNDELKTSKEQLKAAQDELAIGNNRLSQSKEQAAVDAEINKLKKEGLATTGATAAAIIENVRQTQAAKDQAQILTQQYQQQQREIKTLGDGIARDMAGGLETAFKGGGGAFDKMLKGWHNSLDSFLANLISQFAETQLVIPVIESVVGAGGASGPGANGATSQFGSLLGLGSTVSSGSQALGGPSLGSALGLTGETGALAGASSYLFGTAGAGIGASTVGAGSVGTLVLSDGTAVAITSEGAAIPAISGGATSGAIGSGGLGAAAGTAASYAAPVVAGGFAGYEIGGAVGSPGGGALAGAAGGAVTGALIGSVIPIVGTIAGAIIGGIAGAIGGAIGGQHPTVGPNSGGYVSYKNGVGVVGAEAADNGGNDQVAIEMQKAAAAALNNLSAFTGGMLSGVPDLRVGTFNGKYFGTTDATGGTAANATYTNEADAVANGVLMALKQSDLSKVDPNVKTAIGNIQKGSDATTISNDLTFAEQFSAAIAAMKAGVVDFTQSAEVAAETTSSQLVTSIRNFKDQTTALGLDTQAAADATKGAVESFLGLTNSQPVSQLEASVQTLYGKLEGISGLLTEVGISQDEATQKVKAQIDVMLGVSAATPALTGVQQQVQAVTKTFADLSPILQKLGDTASQVAQAVTANIQQIQASVEQDLMTRLNSSSGLDVINTIQGAAVQLKTDLTNLSALPNAGSGDLAAANQIFQNIVTSALNGLAGNTTALDAVIAKYASDTSAAGQFIEQTATKIENFGAQIVGVGTAATSAAGSVSSLQSTFSSAQSAYINALNTQISTTQALISAMQGLSKTANDNLLGDNSALSPKAKLGAAQSIYQGDLSKLQSGTLTGADLAAALQSFGTDATNYETQARNYYGSSGNYASIFNSVQGSLNSLGSGTGYNAATGSLAGLQSELSAAQGLGSTSSTSSGLADLKTAMLTAFNTLQTAVGGTTVAITGVDGRIQSGNQISNAIASSASATVSNTGNTVNAVGGTTGAVNSTTASINALAAIGQLIYSGTNILNTDLQAAIANLMSINIYSGKITFSTAQTAGRLGGIGAYASGGDFGGGLRIVGERGPEIEATGSSRIWDAATTRSMLSGGSANDNLSSSMLDGIRTDNRYAYAAFSQSLDRQNQLTAQLIREVQAMRSEMARSRVMSLVA